jgi:hypothetical protein
LNRIAVLAGARSHCDVMNYKLIKEAPVRCRKCNSSPRHKIFFQIDSRTGGEALLGSGANRKVCSTGPGIGRELRSEMAAIRIHFGALSRFDLHIKFGA